MLRDAGLMGCWRRQTLLHRSIDGPSAILPVGLCCSLFETKKKFRV